MTNKIDLSRREITFNLIINNYEKEDFFESVCSGTSRNRRLGSKQEYE